MERDIEQDVKFDRYQLDKCLEDVGAANLYWSRAATDAENDAEMAKAALKRVEQVEYLRVKSDNPKVTDTTAKAMAVTSDAYTKANEEYLAAVRKANDLACAKNLVIDTIQRMQAEVRLVAAGYFAGDGISGGATNSRLK